MISASVLGPGDRATLHNDGDERQDERDGENAILVSPSVERTGAMLELRVYRAERLPQMDFTIVSAIGGQGVDAYVQLMFGGREGKAESRTRVVKDRNPVFNEAVFCPVVLPSFSDTVAVRVMDYDLIVSDDCIGTLFFSLKQLQDDPARLARPR